MKRRVIGFGMALAIVGVVATVASAAPPKGALRGTFSIGILAQSDQLSKYISASNVWCVWKGDHVIVHVNVRNRSSEHVKATIKPRYEIRNGGEHGSGLTSAKDFGFDARQFRSLWIDAGHPKGVTARTPFSRCAPYLFLIQSG